MRPEPKLKAVPRHMKISTTLKPEDLAQVTTRKGLGQLLRSKQVDIKRAARALRYERELRQLQIVQFILPPPHSFGMSPLFLRL
jgi:hypothetical protein